MFHALADQLSLQRHVHAEIRVELTNRLEQNFLTLNGQHLSMFLESDIYPSWQYYLDYMRHNGNWGDLLILMAAAVNQYNEEITAISMQCQ